MKLLIAALLVFGLVGEARANACKTKIDAFDNVRFEVVECCIDNVAYLTKKYSTAGSISPKYLPSGKIATCDY
jgi:hypothetical protein